VEEIEDIERGGFWRTQKLYWRMILGGFGGFI